MDPETRGTKIRLTATQDYKLTAKQGNKAQVVLFRVGQTISQENTLGRKWGDLKGVDR